MAAPSSDPPAMTPAEAAAMVADRDTPASQLAFVAQHFPQLRAQITKHPQANDELRRWIAALPTVDSSSEPIDGDPSSETPRPDGFPSPRLEQTSNRETRRSARTAWIVVAATAVVVIVGGVVGVVAATHHNSGSTQAAGSSASSSRSAPANTPTPTPTVPPFLSGEKLAWSVSPSPASSYDGNSFVSMTGNANIWVTTKSTTTNSTATFSGDTLIVGFDPATGAQKWSTIVPAGNWDGSSCVMAGSNLVACRFSPDDPSASTTMIATFDLSDGHLVSKAMLSDFGFSGPMSPTLAYADNSIVIQTVGGGDDPSLASIGGMARVSLDLKTMWISGKLNTCPNLDGIKVPETNQLMGGTMVMSDVGMETVVDINTGKILYNPTQCSGVATIADKAIIVAGQAPSSFALSSGQTVPVISTSELGGSAVLVDSSSSPQPLPVGIAYTATGGAAQLSAYDSDGQAAWKNPVTLDVGSQTPYLAASYSNGFLDVVDGSGHVWSIDPNTGKTLWQGSYPALDHGTITEMFGTFSKPAVAFSSDNILLISDIDSAALGQQTVDLTAIDPITGKTVWKLQGYSLITTITPSPGLIAVTTAAGNRPIAALAPANPATPAG